MKVLLVNTGVISVPPLRGGGIEYHTYLLANELTKLRHEVHFVTGVRDSTKLHPQINLHKIKGPSFPFQTGFVQTVVSNAIGGSLAYKVASRVAKNHFFDIVHGQGNVSSALLFTISKSKIPLIYTFHGPDPWMEVSHTKIKQVIREISFRNVDVRIFRRAQHIIAVSKGNKDELIFRWNVPPEKITVILNGVDVEVFKPNIPNSISVREQYNLDFNYCLFVGKLIETKNVNFLIRAMKNVKYHLVIVGDGPQSLFLHELTRQLNILNRVHFLGSVPFEILRKIYAEASFFVLPSKSEGLPAVILEAMATGLPIIGTCIPGVREVIIDGENGFLVEVDDVGALQKRILQLFEDNNLREKMRKNCRREAEEKYSLRTMAKQACRVYEDVINNKTAQGEMFESADRNIME